MSKSLFLFFSFCSIYLILLFLGDFEINFSSFFLWNALQNKSLIFILIGIGIFWSGKEVIDEKERGYSNYFLSNKSLEIIISIIFLASIWCIIFLSIFSEFWLWFNLSHYILWEKKLHFLNNIEYNLIILGLVFSSLLFYMNRRNIVLEKQEEIVSYKQGKKSEFQEKFPKLNKIPIIKQISAWIYWEWWAISTWLVILFIIWSIIIILTAKNQAIHVDDMYTYSAVKWYNLYGEYKSYITGVHYEFPLLFLYFVTKFYNLWMFLWFSETFSLRLFNVILTLIFLATNIFFLNLYNISGKIKLIIFWLITINTAIISTLLIARLYPINILLIIFSLFLIFYLIKTKDLKNKIYFFIWIFILWIISWFFHRVSTVHILILLILAFFYLVYIFISIYKWKWLQYIFILWIISLANLWILLFLRPNTLNFIQQMMFGNEKVAIINFFQSLLTFFQSINILFIWITWIGLLFILMNKKTPNRVFLLFNLCLIISIYLVHKEFLASRTDNIRYMVDISYIFLILFLYSLFYAVKILWKYNYKIFFTLFIVLYIFHNINFLIKTNEKSFSYFQMRNFWLQEKFYLDNNKFNWETLITDLWLPWIEKENKIYFITSTKNSDLQSINNLWKIIDNLDQYRIENDINQQNDKKKYNMSYISNLFPIWEYVYDEKQDFLIKSWLLNVMNKNHLQEIIKKDGWVHILVGFTFFDNWHIDQEKHELRTYILENCKNKVYTTIKKELYINTPLLWKYNDQLMLYCKLEMEEK